MKKNLKADFKKLKCVILHSPIETLDDPVCETIFYQTLKLKVDGFNILRSKYLALDQNDFLATHLVLCDEQEHELKPIMAFKVLSQDQALKWNVPFSGTEVVRKTGSQIHQKAVQEFLNEAKDKGLKVAYPGSFTICRNIVNPEARAELVKIFQALLTFYHKSYYPSLSLCIARDRVHSELFLKEIGFTELSLKGEILPQLNFPQYLNDSFKVMHLTDDFTLHAYRMLKKFSSIVDNATVISLNEGVLTQRLVQHLYPSKTSA